jgi:hypothetical protein
MISKTKNGGNTMTIIGKVRKGNAGKAFGYIAVIVLCAIAMSPKSMASTVAYWPLTGESGVRTTTETVFANEGDGGTMDAVPVVVRNYYGSQEGDAKYLPVGTNAFPTAYGVYDPVAKANKAAATGLNFDSWSMKDNWWTKQYIASYSGCLKVSDADALKLSTFTVECFVMPATGRSGYTQCLAVMPMSVVVEGTKEVVGKESWGIRFYGDRPFLAYSYVAGGTTNYVNTTPSSGTKVPLDNRWHHLAFTVNGTTLKIYIDYVLEYTQTLDGNIVYDQNANLFIGGGTFPKQSYYGSMAHFRVSDEALTPDKFLHFTRTERAADEANDVLLHLNFEAVDGISTNNVFFNQAATGSAIYFGANNNVSAAGYAAFSTDVYTNKLYASRRDVKGFDNLRSLNRTDNSSGEPYLAWCPPEDIFHDSSFTVEFFMKDSNFEAWSHLFKRRVDGSNSANQFWIGGLKTVNRLKCDFGGKAITDSTDIADNKWNHIAVVYDKATRKLAFYRNWSLIGKATISADATIPEVSVNPIMLMGDTASAATTYTGLIDELRITKRALSVKEFLSPEHAKGFLIVIQ